MFESVNEFAKLVPDSRDGEALPSACIAAWTALANSRRDGLADIHKAGGSVREIQETEFPNVPVRLAVVEDFEGNVFEIGHMVDSEGRYTSANQLRSRYD